MTPSEVIQKINQAMCDDDLEAAEKVLEDYAKFKINEHKEAEKEYYDNPYWYWPQCDVDGCDGVSCNGGGCWRETGYWSVCPKHSAEFREGKPQPKMRQSAINKEATRDKVTGCLPSTNQSETTNK